MGVDTTLTGAGSAGSIPVSYWAVKNKLIARQESALRQYLRKTKNWASDFSGVFSGAITDRSIGFIGLNLLK